MPAFFFLIICLSFVSLGLPDSLLGSAWPVMYTNLNAPLEFAGIISILITLGTICSSLASASVLKRFGTGKVTCVSVLMTAVSLFGFSLAPSVSWLFLLAIPLGLGAGAVDTGLNDYVALHYAARYMNWLHCFWGMGAMLGPIIMAQFITRPGAWRGGYFVISMIQFSLVLLLFFTLPLWKESPSTESQENKEEDLQQLSERAHPLRIKGTKSTLASFALYSGTELTVGLWASSFLVGAKGVSASQAAGWVSMYYAGITVGRLITGFLTEKISSRIFIRVGQITICVGALLLILPCHSIVSMTGLILIGLGCAPIFPCMLHQTPVRFGRENRTVMGLQMAFAYIGSTILPPVFGWAAGKISIAVFPYFIATCAMSMLLFSERMNLFLKQ